jgi:hypothetical protein
MKSTREWLKLYPPSLWAPLRDLIPRLQRDVLESAADAVRPDSGMRHHTPKDDTLIMARARVEALKPKGQ